MVRRRFRVLALALPLVFLTIVATACSSQDDSSEPNGSRPGTTQPSPDVVTESGTQTRTAPAEVATTIPSVPTQRSATAGAVFSEGWDGEPATPEPWNPSDWMVLSHWRDPVNWMDGKAVDAHHSGVNCGDVTASGDDPGTLHVVDARDEGRYRCKNHLMTAIDGQEYGLIYFTPPAMVDFSEGPGTVSWSLSTLATSDRDWVDVWISPYADQVAAPFERQDDLDVDLQGTPRNGLQLRQINGVEWAVKWTADDVVTELGIVEVPVPPSAATRSPMEVTMSSTAVSFGFTGHNVTTFDLPDPATWDRGVVQFGHHSYNPTKDCPASSPCTPGSWHWDDLRIEPAVPFSIQRATPEVIVATGEEPTAAQKVSWAGPAPADAVLQFAALCKPQVNDGSGWTDAVLAPFQGQGADGVTRAVEHASSYKTPVAAGASSVQIRFVADDWYTPGTGCMAEGFAITAL